MNINHLVSFALISSTLFACACTVPKSTPPSSETPATTTLPTTSTVIKLPEPKLKSTVSLEEALLRRRSVREYSNATLTLEEVSQILWAAQGITNEWGGRTAPSAGALYPLEVYLVAGNVDNLAIGVYKYESLRHELIKIMDEDVRVNLSEAALNQTWVKTGAISIIIAGVYERTTKKYGDRGVRYVHMEAGHAVQNIYLQATTLDLATVAVGAFNDDQVKTILDMLDDEYPLYIIPIGKKVK